MVGDGIEDMIVAVTVPLLNTQLKIWVMGEVKTPHNQRGEPTPSQFTAAQLEWYERTRGWPRLVFTGAQDAVDKVRRFTR
jgi:hypothetical protein